MSTLKSKIIGNFISAIWIISVLLDAILVDAAYVKSGSKQPLSELTRNVKHPFDDFKAEAEVYSEKYKTLRLKITWKNTNESIFNVVVKPLSGDPCSHNWCNLYGRITDNSTVFVPQEPLGDVDHSSCEITPGCSYTVIVESHTNTFESELIYTVPDPVGNVHSCKHAENLPSVKVTGKIHSQIMTLTWEIIGSYNVPSDINVYIIIIITDINDFRKELQVFNDTLDPEQRSGQFEWNIPKNGSDYMTRTFVVDSKYCSSKNNPYLVQVKVPPKIVKYTTSESPVEEKHIIVQDDKYSAHVVWLTIGVSSFVILIILIASLIYSNKVNETRIYWKSIFGPQRAGATIPMKINPRYDYTGYTNDELYEIPHSNIRLLKEIGRGAFGRVYLARGIDICGIRGHQNVAVKQLNKRPTDEDTDEFFHEIQTMKVVKRHPNIVAILGFCTVKEPLQIVMEYVACGDLLSYLRKIRDKHGKNRLIDQSESDHPFLPPTRGRYLDLMNSSTTSTSDSSHATETDGNNLRPSLTETMYTTLDPLSSSRNSLEYVLNHNELHDFATQIAKGMTHLHELKITHRDLAARNILIDENKVLKISDFGLSRNGIYVNTKNKKVPLRWLSIEAIRDSLFSDKSDVWAFGIVLWEIGTLGGQPYQDPYVANEDLLPYLFSGERLQQPPNCSKYLYDLMLHCWAHQADDRPAFDEILSKLEPSHQTIYVDFSEISSDYVFPPIKRT